MSLRARGDDLPGQKPTAGVRASDAALRPMRGTLAAPTGAFFQAADFNEWEGLDQRLTKLEGQLSGTMGGYKTFQQEFQVLSGNFAQLLTRVGDIERQVQQMSANVDQVKRQQSSFETAEMGRETRYQNLERQLSRMDDRIRAHSQNDSLHSHDDGGSSYQPQGFQANDQPRSFMGSSSRR